MVRNKLLRLAMLLVLALQALTACGSDRGSSATNDATAVHSEADLFKDFGFVSPDGTEDLQILTDSGLGGDLGGGTGEDNKI